MAYTFAYQGKFNIFCAPLYCFNFRLPALGLILMIAGSMTNFSCGKKVESQVDRSTLANCKLPAADGLTSVGIGGFPRASYRLKSTGQVTATVIMVDFSDAVASKTPDEAYAMLSGATSTFTEMSYGRFTYTLNPKKKWYRMSKKSDEYAFSGRGHLDYMKEAVALADSEVDFSTTDILVVLSNPDAANVGNFNGRGPAWPGMPGSGIIADGKEIINGVTSSKDLNTWGSIWLNHETTHTLGLVDLYSYDAGSGSLGDLIRYTGGYSYMGVNSFDSNSPGMLAWERWTLGWLDDSQMNCVNPHRDGLISAKITPVHSSGGLKALVVPVAETKAVVVEYRLPSGIDKNLSKSGVLVYVIDSSLQSGRGPVQVLPKPSSSDPYFLQSTRAVGDSVEVENLRIDVIAAGSTDAEVRVVPLGVISGF
ncbi:MAG: hypothetical protein NT027_20175 [Proteobacteria bacterium]|nr:hypothetical protein [Pseudomonadota bacterium]